MIELKAATYLFYDEIEIDDDGRGFSWNGGRIDFADCVEGGHHAVMARRKHYPKEPILIGARDITADPPYFEFNGFHPVIITFPREPSGFFDMLGAVLSSGGLRQDFHDFQSKLKGFGWITHDRS